jgi:hypothetical protein
MTSNGNGDEIHRGLGYLAALQRSDGAWPRIPIRRTPGDALVTALVLQQLGADERFRGQIRFNEAIAWMETEESSMDPEVRRLWESVRRRVRLQTYKFERLGVLS